MVRVNREDGIEARVGHGRPGQAGPLKGAQQDMGALGVLDGSDDPPVHHELGRAMEKLALVEEQVHAARSHRPRAANRSGSPEW
jgi:hypothetical protein